MQQNHWTITKCHFSSNRRLVTLSQILSNIPLTWWLSLLKVNYPNGKSSTVKFCSYYTTVFTVNTFSIGWCTGEIVFVCDLSRWAFLCEENQTLTLLMPDWVINNTLLRFVWKWLCDIVSYNLCCSYIDMNLGLSSLWWPDPLLESILDDLPQNVSAVSNLVSIEPEFASPGRIC